MRLKIFERIPFKNISGVQFVAQAMDSRNDVTFRVDYFEFLANVANVTIYCTVAYIDSLTIGCVGAVRRMRTRIRLLVQPEPRRSIVGATQQEQRFD